MKTIMIITAVATIVAGCGGAPTETAKLRPPAGYLMAQPCKMPAIPKDEANPTSRGVYYGESRTCAARRGDQVRGLQRYIRTTRGGG